MRSTRNWNTLKEIRKNCKSVPRFTPQSTDRFVYECKFEFSMKRGKKRGRCYHFFLFPFFDIRDSIRMRERRNLMRQLSRKEKPGRLYELDSDHIWSSIERDFAVLHSERAWNKVVELEICSIFQTMRAGSRSVFYLFRIPAASDLFSRSRVFSNRKKMRL